MIDIEHMQCLTYTRHMLSMCLIYVLIRKISYINYILDILRIYTITENNTTCELNVCRIYN